MEDLRGTESGGRKPHCTGAGKSGRTAHIRYQHGNGIVAKIKSDDREICAIISDQIQKLVQSMENKGITVENVDVLFEQAGRDMGFDGKASATERKVSQQGV